MELIIIAILALLVLGLGLSLKGGSAAPAAPPRRANPTGGRRSDEERRPAAPPAEPSPPPVSVWRFQPAPQEAGDGQVKGADESDMSSVMAQAEGIAGHLKARQSVLARVSGADFNPKQVSDLVTRDPALAAHVLRIVNSPFYGLSQKVGSVFRAVVYLGHVEVRNIIWQACVSDGLGSQNALTGRLVEDLWAHSFAASKVAYALARSLNLPEPDKLATTALLHDIGKLISLNVWPDRARSLYYPVHFSDWSVIVEEARLGAHHSQLGAEVAKVWGLPDESVEAIREHHAPSYRSAEHFAPSNRKTIAVVHLADILVHAAQPPREPGEDGEEREDPPIYLPDQTWLTLLGVDDIEKLFTPAVRSALPRRSPAQPPRVRAPQGDPVTVD